MFDALHPNINTLISFSEYLQFALQNGYQKANDALGARCPVCERRMKIRAGKKKDDGHFYHNDDLFCPTKDPAKRPYLGLPPKTIDPIAEQSNRTFVTNNIEKIWCRLNAQRSPHFLILK